MNKPELETLGYKPDEPVNCETCGDTGKVYGDPYGEDCKKCPEQPNSNAMIVKTIQSLMTVVNNELVKLGENSERMSRKAVVLKALEEIDLFERTTLFELQKAFE